MGVMSNRKMALSLRGSMSCHKSGCRAHKRTDKTYEKSRIPEVITVEGVENVENEIWLVRFKIFYQAILKFHV